MALVIETTSSVTSNNADNLTITKPTGVAVGDLLIVIAAGAPSAGNYATVTGFTASIQNQAEGLTIPSTAFLYKVADAGDVAASNYTIGLGGANSLGAAVMLRISGWVAGNPVYSSSAGSVINQDVASEVLTQTGLSLARPTAQIMFLFGCATGNEYSTFATYSATSSDANPSWTELAEIDFATNTSTVLGTLFVAYAQTSNTSNVTAYAITRTASTAFSGESSAYSLAIVCEPISKTGTNTLLSVSPTTFLNTGVVVGTAGTNTLLAVSPTMLDQSGRGETPTVWTPEVKTATTWTPEIK